VRQLFGLPRVPAMLMAVASLQSDMRPAATSPVCLTRLSPAAASLASSITDFSVTHATVQHWRAAGNANGFQQAANPPKSAPCSLQKFAEEGEDLLPSRSTTLPNFITLRQPTLEISLTKNLADKHRQKQ